MSMEQSDAIVVKSVEFSESSLVLTLFTRDFGKVRGLAKGARRLKNPFETSLDLLASVKLSFIRKNSDALDLLTEAKLIRRFRPTSKNLRGLCAGYYLAELLDLGTADYQPYPELWRLASSSLDAFARRPEVEPRVAAFEAAYLNALGEFPSLRCCVECGEELPLDAALKPDRQIWFELEAGGIVCTKCRARKQFFALVPTTVRALRALESSLRASEMLTVSSDAFDRALTAIREKSAGKDGRRLFATELDELEEAAREERDRIETTALAEYSGLSREARADRRELVCRYLLRILRRRPRMFDYLSYATGERSADI